MRALGLDVGERWIGAALSDPSGTLATPLARIDGRVPEASMLAICELVEQHEVERIVVGLPYSMDGSLGPQARKVDDFVRNLRASVAVAVETWDERLSTVAAERRMAEAGIGKQRRKESIDSAAAALILQAYLDSLRSQRP